MARSRRLFGKRFGVVKFLCLPKGQPTSGQPLNYDPLPGDANYETVEAVRRLYPEASDSEVAQEALARMAETMPNVGWFRMAMARTSSG